MGSEHDKIRARAYDLWDQDGRQHGREQDYWLQAERELAAAGAMGMGAPNPPAATAGETPVLAPANANAKANGAGKTLAAKNAPRKRRGAQPQSQA